MWHTLQMDCVACAPTGRTPLCGRFQAAACESAWSAMLAVPCCSRRLLSGRHVSKRSHAVSFVDSYTGLLAPELSFGSTSGCSLFLNGDCNAVAVTDALSTSGAGPFHTRFSANGGETTLSSYKNTYNIPDSIALIEHRTDYRLSFWEPVQSSWAGLPLRSGCSSS